jgi:hypothetical protein
MLTMTDPYDLHTGIGYQLTIAARTNNSQFEKNLSKLGLTRQMWCVLIAVGEQRIITPSAIADYIGIIRPAGFSHAETNGSSWFTSPNHG